MNDDGYVIEWPLWGLRMPDRPTGLDGALQVGEGLLYQPTWSQWNNMEYGDIVSENAGQYLYAERLGAAVHSLPPVCALRLSTAGADGEPDPTVDEQEHEARNLFEALRLYSPGDFVDPSETGVYVTYPNDLVVRAVRPFRSAFYGSSPADPYVVGADDCEPLDDLAALVGVVRQNPEHVNAALAIENFRLSFGSAASPAERALHRFIALEALLGRVGGSTAGAPFAVRARHAAADAGPDAETWLASVRELRNAVAHGIASADPTEEDLAMLEAITREILLSYLNYISTGNHPDPLAGFNRALAAGPIGTQ